MKGWISLHKQIKNNWVWDNPKYLKAWIDMLLRANYSSLKKPYKDTVVTIQRGEFPTSYRALAVEWGMSKNTVIKFINRLKADTMIDTHTDFGFLVVKINNFDKFQSMTDTVADTVSGTPSGTGSGTPGGTTYNNNNNINKRNNSGVVKKQTPTLKERFAIFTEKVNQVGQEKELPKAEIDKFINHWGAHNEGGKKMRWEMEKVFDLPRRIATWKTNINAFNWDQKKAITVESPKQIEKTTKYICYGCNKTKMITGDLKPSDAYCDCGDQFMKPYEYNILKSKDNPVQAPKKKLLSDAEILEKVGFGIKTMA